ncbi:hypothetical protein QP150_01335 [Sphingomonas sp. 22L2VL55-3]
MTLLAGFYPAFVISRFLPAGVLAAARTLAAIARAQDYARHWW